MTSGKFELLSVNSIVVDREGRQRRELIGIEELATSIRDNGLINPIVVTSDLELVAGERRLAAHKLLGFDTIAVQYVIDLDNVALHLIELEENIRREDLAWQDHVNAVTQYHSLRTLRAGDKGEPWSQSQTAEELGMSKQVVGRHLLVRRAIEAGVSEVIAAPKFSTAANFAERAQERKKTATLRELRQTSPQEDEASSAELEGEEGITTPNRYPNIYANILEADFISWSETIQDVPYNLIHCDFPYGVNTGDTRGQSAAKGFGGYRTSRIFTSICSTCY